MEGDAEQPALAATTDQIAQVQEWLGQDLAILGNADAPRLLDDEEAATAITRVDHLNGLIEAVGHEVEIEVKDTRFACRGTRSPNNGEGNRKCKCQREEPDTSQERQQPSRLRTPPARPEPSRRRCAVAPPLVAPAGSCSDRATRPGCCPPRPRPLRGTPRRRREWAGPARTGERGRPAAA